MDSAAGVVGPVVDRERSARYGVLDEEEAARDVLRRRLTTGARDVIRAEMMRALLGSPPAPLVVSTSRGEEGAGPGDAAAAEDAAVRRLRPTRSEQLGRPLSANDGEAMMTPSPPRQPGTHQQLPPADIAHAIAVANEARFGSLLLKDSREEAMRKTLVQQERQANSATGAVARLRALRPSRSS